MLKKAAISAGVFAISMISAGSIAFAQTATPTTEPTSATTPTVTVAPTTSTTMPSTAPATGHVK